MEKTLVTGESLGTITSITELYDFKVRPIGPLHGSQGARAGFSSMIGMLQGHSSMQGFQVETDKACLACPDR